MFQVPVAKQMDARKRLSGLQLYIRSRFWGSEVLTSSFVDLCFANGSPSGEATREFIELNTGQQMTM